MKKQTRKLLALLICLALAVGLLPMSALADGVEGKHRAVFSADDAVGRAGEAVKVNVNLDQNDGIAAGKITLTCEPTTCEKIELGDREVYEDYRLQKDGSYKGDNEGFLVNPAEGMCDWYAIKEYNDTGVYAVYTLLINEDAEPGDYTITGVADDLAGVQTNEDGNEVVVSYKDGEYEPTQTFIATLTVLPDEPVEPSKNRAVFTADDVTAKAGETVDINVNITENEGIAAARVTLSCDQAVIDKISRGNWVSKDIGEYGYSTETGIYNWANKYEVDDEGVYAVYTVTVNDDVAPGTYDVVLVAEDLAGVQTNEDGEEVVVSYKEGEYYPSQTYIATLTVVEDEPIAPADVVVDTVTATCGVGETADVDISYVGGSEITSIRMKIDSEIPVDSVTSDYEYEYNDENNMIVIWAEEGAKFGDSVIATLHFDLEVDPWYDDGEYPVNIEIIEATNGEVKKVELAAESGALIIDNAYMPGDVNMDGYVDNRDVVMIARYLVELEKFNEKQMIIADFNHDDEVDNIDLVLICQYIVA